MSCGLLETLKFSVLELQEHLDTYNVKREAAEQVGLFCISNQKTLEHIHQEIVPGLYPSTQIPQVNCIKSELKSCFLFSLLFCV